MGCPLRVTMWHPPVLEITVVRTSLASSNVTAIPVEATHLGSPESVLVSSLSSSQAKQTVTTETASHRIHTSSVVCSLFSGHAKLEKHSCLTACLAVWLRIASLVLLLQPLVSPSVHAWHRIALASEEMTTQEMMMMPFAISA